MLDDLSITNYSGTTAVKDLEYHSWDAFCRDGVLVIENEDAANSFAVYGVDGISRYEGCPGEGVHSLNLSAGLYIVVVNDFSRRVLVK